MHQHTHQEHLPDETEYRLLRERYILLKKQMNHVQDHDTLLVERSQQAEIKMLKEKLRMLEYPHQKTFM